MTGGSNCCIVGCTATQARCRGLSFHRLPRKDKPDDWWAKMIVKISRSDMKFNPDKARICSRHFEDGCFRYGQSGRRQLIDGSLPTKYMPERSIETPKPETKPEMVCVLDVSMATTMPDDQIHLRVQDLNPVLTCELCGGYYVGATTITTCLHTFCRSCIARHTDFSLHCPKCDLLIHPTDPYVNMRPDCTIQDIVYKLLPLLEKDEKRRERKFYTSRGIPYPLQPTATPRRKQMKEGTRWVSQAPCVHLISVKLIYLGTKPGLGSYPPLVNKYLRIPDYTTIGHIERFVQQTLHVHATRQVCVFIGTCLLHETLTLVRSVELSRRGGDQEKMDEDEDALVKLHYGIVPRKNYFEYFARDGAASSRVNSDKVNNSSDKVNNSSDKVNNSSDKVNNSSSVVTVSSGVMNPDSGVVTPSSGVTATVDTVTLDDSDDCIIIS